MKLALKILAGTLLSLVAPLVTLVYRRGWFDTPDDTVSPRGMYEDSIYDLNTWVLEKTGSRAIADWVSDYWWLGFRNRAYGFDYLMKPDFFKQLPSYDNLTIGVRNRRVLGVLIRSIWVEGYEEHTLHFKWFHVIYGYRLRPIYDEVFKNKYMNAQIPFRPLNMDARPIFSIRAGEYDD
jgi:hypothetical protein